MVSKVLVRFFNDFLKKYKVAYIAIFFVSLIQMFFVMIVPLCQSKLVNVATDNLILNEFIFLTFALVISLLFSHTLDFIKNFFLERNTELVAEDIRNALNKKCCEIEASYFDTNTFSDLASKYQKEVAIIEGLGANIFINLVVNIIKCICVILMMLSLNVTITFIIIGTFIIYIFLYKLLANIIKKNMKKNLKYNEELFDIINDNHNNAINIKINVLYEYAKSRFMYKNSKYTKSNIKIDFIYLLNRNIAVYTVVFGIIFIWIIGGLNIINSTMSIGEILALISYQSILFAPISYFSSFSNTYNSAIIALEKLYLFLDYNDENISGKTISEINSITIKNIIFSFNSKSVLNNLNMRMEKGNIYMIIGKSGEGKSTLIKLLAKLYRPISGEILIDNLDLQDIHAISLREEIGISFQNNLFFYDSIINNININNNLNIDKIKNISKELDIYNEINLLNNKWDTKIENKAANLSTGQAKRLDLLRVCAKDSSVLIFDEPTSCLDNLRKDKFYKYIKSIKKDKIIVLITHNIDEIKNADKIYLLNKGSLKSIDHNYIENNTYKIFS